MAKMLLLAMGIVAIFEAFTIAAPNSDSISKSDSHKDTVDSESLNLEISDSGSGESQRQKRYFDIASLDYPSFDFPFSLPHRNPSHYSKRDESRNTAFHGNEDPLRLIYSRLQDIIKDIRQQKVPVQHYPQTTIPAYIPIFYLPPIDCSCSTTNHGSAPPTGKPTLKPTVPPATKPQTPTTSTETMVSLEDRFSGTDEGNNLDSDDGSRPVNLNPVPTEEPIGVPVPPVDHGTVQAGAEPEEKPSQSPSNDVSRFPPSLDVDSQTISVPDFERPNLCDGAILSCCNQERIARKCFDSLGCEDPFIYGKPCEPKVQLMVVKKFEHFHKRRSG